MGIPQGNGAAMAPPDWENLLEGWKEFKDGPLILSIVISLLLSLLLGLAIAYHPKRKVATLDDVEQPKIFLLYTLVGALVGQVCGVNQAMALVIFGLGGLFRFRTDVGPARDTGRLILVTLIGILCGLSQFVPAVAATAFGWTLIYFLARTAAHRVLIKGIEPPVLRQAADAYQEVLLENGLLVMSKKINFLKHQVGFVVRAPGELDIEQLEDVFKDIPPKLQGAAEWESS